MSKASRTLEKATSSIKSVRDDACIDLFTQSWDHRDILEFSRIIENKGIRWTKTLYGIVKMWYLKRNAEELWQDIQDSNELELNCHRFLVKKVNFLSIHNTNDLKGATLRNLVENAPSEENNPFIGAPVLSKGKKEPDLFEKSINRNRRKRNGFFKKLIDLIF